MIVQTLPLLERFLCLPQKLTCKNKCQFLFRRLQVPFVTFISRHSVSQYKSKISNFCCHTFMNFFPEALLIICAEKFFRKYSSQFSRRRFFMFSPESAHNAQTSLIAYCRAEQLVPLNTNVWASLRVGSQRWRFRIPLLAIFFTHSFRNPVTHSFVSRAKKGFFDKI